MEKGECGYMEDAIDSVAADVFSIYLNRFDKKMSKEEKIKSLAKSFEIPVREVREILKDAD